VVITMSVMPPFTYHNHMAITVLRDLQIFPCPMNEDAMRVHCDTPSVTVVAIVFKQ
jgi:hypothetical protein